MTLLRRPVWEANKWIARGLTDAFIRGNDMFDAAQRGFPYVSPWLEADLEATEAVMGTDFHPYGFEKNRRTIEVFANQAFELGIVGRRISPVSYTHLAPPSAAPDPPKFAAPSSSCPRCRSRRCGNILSLIHI